jgi:hypothetical protein
LIGDYLSKLRLPEGSTIKERNAIIREARHYVLMNGNLYRRPVAGRGLPAKVVVGEAARQDILTQIHDFGHRGNTGTYQLVRERYWWPKLADDVEEFVRTCEECQKRDKRHYEETRTVMRAPTLFATWHIDCIAMGSAPGGKPQFVIVARDSLSGWLEAKAVRRPTAADVRGFFHKQILTRYGVTSHVVTDNGPEFKGEFARELALYRIKLVRTSPYNPGANGVVERGNAPLKESLFKMVLRTGKPWWENLDLAVWADRATAKRVTGCTPYFLMYGQECVLPINMTEEGLLMINWQNISSTKELLEARMVQLARRPEELAKAKACLREVRELSVAHHNEKWELRQRNRDFKPGELVLVRNNKQDNSHQVKSEPKYLGPFRVIGRNQGGAYHLCELDGTKFKGRIGHNRVRRYDERRGALILDRRAAGLELEDELDQAQDDSDDERATLREQTLRQLGNNTSGLSERPVEPVLELNQTPLQEHNRKARQRLVPVVEIPSRGAKR